MRRYAPVLNTEAAAATCEAPVGRPPAGRRPWRILVRAVALDLRLQVRYKIVAVAAMITALYAIGFQLVPERPSETLVVVLVFSDPTTIGFLFVGVLVLFERGAGTLQAVVVTPLSTAQYVSSKAISLTLVAVVCSLVTAVSAGHSFDVVLFVVATALSSLLLVFIGLVAVVRVRSVNAYLVIVPLFLLPLTLPLVQTIGKLESPLLYALPTQGSLLLLRAAFEPRPAAEIAYGVAILTAAVALALHWAISSFDRHGRTQGG